MFSDIIESVKRYYPQTVDLIKWNLHNKPQLLGRRAAYFFVLRQRAIIETTRMLIVSTMLSIS